MSMLEPLIVQRKSAADLFHDKTAATVSRMPDDEKKWPAHIYSELLKELPYLARYDVEIVLDRLEPEAGAALGFAQVSTKTMSRPQEAVLVPGNVLRIPIIVQDRRLQKFHIFEAGGQTYPLTEERVQQAMLNPAIFDTDASRMPSSPSLLDQVYPPYQQRQGFGRVSEPAAMGLSKISSAPPEEQAKKEAGAGTTAATAALGALAGGAHGALRDHKTRQLANLLDEHAVRSGAMSPAEQSQRAGQRKKHAILDAAIEGAGGAAVAGSAAHLGQKHLPALKEKALDAFSRKFQSLKGELGHEADSFVRRRVQNAAPQFDAMAEQMGQKGVQAAEAEAENAAKRLRRKLPFAPKEGAAPAWWGRSPEPEKVAEHVAAPDPQAVNTALQHVLIKLLALHQMYYFAHWTSQEQPFYGDHLLFTRLYEGVQKEFDDVAERLVGAGGGSHAFDPAAIFPEAAAQSAQWLQAGSSIFQVATAAEEELQAALLEAYQHLDAAGGLSLGIDDLLMGIASNHDGHLYLLKQREGAALTQPVLEQPVQEQPVQAQAQASPPVQEAPARAPAAPAAPVQQQAPAAQV